VLSLVPELVAFGPPSWRNAEQMTKTDVAVVEEALSVLENSETVVVFVALIDANIVGFVHVRLAVDYYLKASLPHIADLVVAPQARGHGIATKLLEIAESWARNQRFAQLTLAVFERNADALALYERRGFERETIRLIKQLDVGDS
jgi:ribosomal protein S18 acetylase RimI-like enzyme